MNSFARMRQEARERWARVRRSEGWYARQLRGIADQVGLLVKGFAPDGQLSESAGRKLADALRQYSRVLEPWARTVSEKMHLEVGRHDGDAWIATARSLGRELRKELREADTGTLVRASLDEQVALITSLPLEAARRVHELAQRAVVGGSRGQELRDDIMRTGLVTKARANLIARTEVARVQSLITQARAAQLNSPGYVWRSMEDQDVRPRADLPHFAQLNTFERGSHRKLNGTFHRWSDPPIAGPQGQRAHPGQIFNCRCYPDPVLDEDELQELLEGPLKTKKGTLVPLG